MNSPQDVADRGAGFLDFPAPRHPKTPQEAADQALAVDREIRRELRGTLGLNYGRAKGL